MRTYSLSKYHDDFSSELGTVYEEQRTGINQREETLAYIAFKFDKAYSIKDLKTHIISNLILQDMHFSDNISQDPNIAVHQLTLEDCCTLHFFDEAYAKKCIICSRNPRENASYNAKNCAFVYESVLRDILDSYGIHTEHIDSKQDHFDSLLE